MLGKPKRLLRSPFLLGALLCFSVLQAAAAELAAPVVSATFAPDGRLWRVLPKKKYVEVDFSDDLGATFSESRRANRKKQRIRANSEDRPGIVVDGSGRIYVLYFADEKKPWTTFLSHSDDNGQTFSIPHKTSDQADIANTNQDQLFLDARNRLHIFWIDERGRESNTRPGGVLYHLVAEGGSWERVTNRKIHDAMCECCRFGIDQNSDGNPVLFGRLVIDERIRDHGLIHVASNDQPHDPLRVTDDQWVINACPEHGPALSVSADNHYHFAWFTLGNARQGLFYAKSVDSGTTLSTPMRIGRTENLAGHPDVLAHEGMVYLTWQQYDGQRTTIMSMSSADNGMSWSEPIDVASATGPTDYPFLITDGTSVYVSWYSEVEGYALIPVSRGDTG